MSTLARRRYLSDPDPLAYWNAFGKSNQDADRGVLVDKTGNGYDLTLYNMAFEGMSGYNDNALIFDGIDDYATTVNQLPSFWDSGYSVVLNHEMGVSSGPYPTVYQKGSNVNRMYYDSSGVANIHIFNSPSGQLMPLGFKPVAISVSALGVQKNIYDVSGNTITQIKDSIGDLPSLFRLGRGAVGRYAQMLFYSCAVFNTALTWGQIKKVYIKMNNNKL